MKFSADGHRFADFRCGLSFAFKNKQMLASLCKLRHEDKLDKSTIGRGWPLEITFFSPERSVFCKPKFLRVSKFKDNKREGPLRDE